MSKAAYQLNQSIEALIAEKGTNSAKYSEENRQYIRQFTGYGGLDKFGATGKGILYEFYTPEEIIKLMWGLALKRGFKGGQVLEPAAGTGEFIRYAPNRDKLQKPLSFTAIEINAISATILRILYPGVRTLNQAFEQYFIENNESVRAKVMPEYDLVIGNPPYGAIKGFSGGKYFNMGEGTYTKALYYDEYFMFRALDVLKSNGLCIYIIGAEVANGGVPWLQKRMTKTKEMIMQKAELLEAFRLPNGVFDRTDVLSDILVLRKKNN